MPARSTIGNSGTVPPSLGSRRPPLFSIVTVTYNAGRHIERTIDSLREQDHRLFEWLVIDGASTDDTLRPVHHYREQHPDTVVVCEPDRGTYDAMNKGIARASGDYLLFLNAGDTLRPNVLATIAPELTPSIDLLYGNIYHEEKRMVCFGPYDRYRLCLRTLPHQATFYHRRIVERVGGYDLRFPVAADYAFNLRSFGIEGLRHKHLNLVVSDFMAGGFSGYRADEAFCFAKPKLIRSQLGEEVYDFYHRSGARFLDILRFCKRERFIVVDSRQTGEIAKTWVKQRNRNFHADNSVVAFTTGDSHHWKEQLDELPIIPPKDAAKERGSWYLIGSDTPQTTIDALHKWGADPTRFVRVARMIFTQPLNALAESGVERDLYLFGAGQAGRTVLAHLRECRPKHHSAPVVRGFIDNAPDKWGTRVDGCPVNSPEHLREHPEAIVIITSEWGCEIRERLNSLGIDQERIIDAAY